jgi:hypothetical protein
MGLAQVVPRPLGQWPENLAALTEGDSMGMVSIERVALDVLFAACSNSQLTQSNRSSTAIKTKFEASTSKFID